MEIKHLHTLAHELGGWRDGSKAGRFFLVLEAMISRPPAPRLSVEHEAIEGDLLELRYHVAFRSRDEIFATARGEAALDAIRSFGLSPTCALSLEELEEAIPLCEASRAPTTNALCVHAPADSHICPGRGYGCSCCALAAEPTIHWQGQVGIVRSGSRLEASEKCEHDVIGRDFGCGYHQGRAWLCRPIPDERWERLAALLHEPALASLPARLLAHNEALARDIASASPEELEAAARLFDHLAGDGGEA